MPNRPDVPALVCRYLGRALPSGEDTPRRVRVEQAGEMWQKPGGRALRFTAVEEFAVEEVAFSWRARFPILPLVAIRVVDRYAAGEGLLEARVLGMRVMRRRGQETAEGEAMRYLAEIPWVPHAILANHELEWRSLDARSVEVATQVGSARVAVRLDFDAAGDIVRAFADGRPHPEGKAIVPRPWESATARLIGRPACPGNRQSWSDTRSDFEALKPIDFRVLPTIVRRRWGESGSRAVAEPRREPKTSLTGASRN